MAKDEKFKEYYDALDKMKKENKEQLGDAKRAVTEAEKNVKAAEKNLDKAKDILATAKSLVNNIETLGKVFEHLGNPVVLEAMVSQKKVIMPDELEAAKAAADAANARIPDKNADKSRGQER